MTRIHNTPAAVAALLAAVLAVGCAGPRAPTLLPATLEVETWYEQGRPLLDVATRSDPPSPGLALPVAIQIHALERTPLHVLQPLTEAAGMVTRPDVPVPLRAVPGPTRGVRLGVDATGDLLADMQRGRWGAAALVEERPGLLVPGTTMQLGVWVEPALDIEPDGTPVRVGFSLGAAGTTDEPLGLALKLVQGHPPQRTEESAEAFPSVLRVSREVAHWAPDAQAPTTLALVVPSPFADGAASAFLLLVEVAPAPDASDPGWEQHVGRFEDILATAIPRVRPPVAPGLMLAREGLSSAAHARNALVYLADQTGTRFSRDVALAAPDDLVSAYAQAVLDRWPDVTAEDLQPALGPVLVRAAYGLVADRADAGTLTTRMRGVLLFYAGEVGNHPALLREILGNADTLDALSEAVIRENLDFLRDSSPAARVRAYDWLARVDRTPPGYDPLEPDRTRRKAALRAFEEARAAEAAEAAAAAEGAP